MRHISLTVSRLLFSVALILLLGMPAQRVSAADIRVDEACSLHDAIVAANTDRPAGGCPAGAGTDDIAIAEDITLNAALPPITSGIIIRGGGHTISGDGKFRIFDVDGGSLTIRQLTLADGQSHDAELLDRDGGAIRAIDATVVVENSRLNNNTADYGGGAIHVRDAKLTISSSSFSGNRAAVWGGAIYELGSKIEVNAGSFTDNHARSGGAIKSLGGIRGSFWTVNNSTFSQNVATGEGGAIWMQRGVRAILNHVTVAFNSASAGGGIFNRRGDLSIYNTIIAENAPNDCPHLIERNEGNLIQRGNCEQAFRADPLLLPLTGNPAYHPLRDYSPAINAALAEHCIEVDQAGTRRPNRCDIGAIESASGIEAQPTPESAHCTLADQIIAANTDAPSGACPAGDGPDTIEITGDIKLPNQLPSISSTITIEGGGYTISGDNHYQIFEVDGGDLTINDLSLKQGYGESGGAIGVTNGGALTINRSVICQNAAEIEAGAIFAEGHSDVVISNSTICDNISHGYTGGAIEIRGESSLVLQDSKIEGNTAAYEEGGGIYLWNSEALISGSVISSNHAGTGGAIYSRGPSILTIKRSSIHGNTSFNRSGGIYADETILSIENSTISNNRATYLSWEEGYSSGGGIYGSDSDVTLHHVTLAYNRAGDGGGLDVYGGSLDIRNSIIAENEGGDCYLRADADVIVVSGNFFGDGTCENNSTRSAHLLPLTDAEPYHALKAESPAVNAADPEHCLPVDQLGKARPAGDGCDIGAVESPYEHAIEPTPATRCTLADQILAANRDEPVGACPAGKGADIISIQADITLDAALPPITSEITIEGNGFSISGDERFQIFYLIGGKLTVNNATLRDGASYAGGAIRARQGSELTINNSVLRGNSAVVGGAVLLSQGKLTIDGSSFYDNQSEYQGGAIHVYDSDMRISRSAINDNSAARSGGAVFFRATDAELLNTTISGNSADMWGGAIQAYGGDIDLVHVTITDNSAPEFGGISGNSSYIDLVNSILANNPGGDCEPPGQYRPWVSSRMSLIGDESCEAAFTGDPLLGALVEKGGFRPLLAGSPAIDAADPTFCPPSDQLGNPRPQGAGCDLGAIEYLGEPS